jgi:cytochrome c556
VLAIACTQPGELAHEPEAVQAPPAMRHAVQSERMRELMASLHRLERGRLPQAMDVELERQRRIEDIARTARDLATAAATLAELASELEHTEADREAFVGFARALERDSASLAEDAPTLSAAAVRARARAIRADCERCHARFRADSIGSQP